MLLPTQMLKHSKPKTSLAYSLKPPHHNRHFTADGQSVIECMKRCYRKQLLSKLLFEGDDDEEEVACSIVQFWKALTLKYCVYVINEAWESVKEHTLKRSWRKLAPYLENVDQSNDSGSVTVTELNGLLKQISGCGNREEDHVSSWLDCDTGDAGESLCDDEEDYDEELESQEYDEEEFYRQLNEECSEATDYDDEEDYDDDEGYSD
ncbi:hypothetical protein AVEN_20925-1 [Araneus ventricosus]|uniref:DDE-1 domain-containing protein n=1 Tax=Araneus ventricosus TaxID=182803 RepID=A0A4Y2L314_ARAVE|nr:hypothetical protein AVEN_20925-1 [Araneus ventricosus]